MTTEDFIIDLFCRIKVIDTYLEFMSAMAVVPAQIQTERVCLRL